MLYEFLVIIIIILKKQRIRIQIHLKMQEYIFFFLNKVVSVCFYYEKTSKKNMQYDITNV
jgi:hypothetical protein